VGNEPTSNEHTEPARPPASSDALPSGDPLAESVHFEKQPLWAYFLTPAAVVIGAVIIAGAIWWTRSETKTTPGTNEVAVVGAVSTAPPASPAASTAVSLIEAVRSYAREVGLDETQFNACVANPASVALLNSQLQAGSTLGVKGTPTFFINNKKLVGSQPAAILDEIIQAELKGSPTSLDGYSAAIRQLASTNPPNFEITAAKPDLSGAPIEGNANAKVIVAEYSDFQCPFCKQWVDNSLRQLRAKLGNDVALAFVNFPLVQIHPNAGNAAVVALCAGQQGKFWQMHDLLFAKQAEWANLK
jgi:protein-disulfide isomerase